MKKMLFIAAGLMLSAIVGCAATSDATSKATSIVEHVNTLRTKGCEAVPKPALKLLVLVVKSKIEHYPPNGICDPNWVQDVLIENLELLEGVYGIQNRSEAVGYTAYSRYRQLDQSDGTGLFLATSTANGNSAAWIRDRSGVDTQDSALVYAPSIEAHSGGSSGTRLYLHSPVQMVHQEASRSDNSRSNGLCGLPGTNLETQCGLYSGSNWRQG